ncbi:PH domain-containing protein [Streptomyces sp. TLI_185]|uniref:PH domain-containing protein n=1 Tax=Streptomyces sp. TLI_185 TaxID=2485151 RepID=UPI000F50EC35|nr:PH domain-containing protein [Streptomyces sp. TLI_185]RPF31337.1 PH (Pleckstrin Homology) domain-containing protein [Streptomyces sp. TLI_185]
MDATIRNPWTNGLRCAGLLMLGAVVLSLVTEAPEPFGLFLCPVPAVAVTWLAWRALSSRLRVSRDGIRSRGLGRTRFVAWDDLVVVESGIDWWTNGALWECPVAILFDGSVVTLTGVHGLRSEGESRVDRIAKDLNRMCDER